MRGLCHRFFFALLPPRRAASEIERLSSMLGPGKRVRTNHLHVTLAITADYCAPPIELAGRMMRIPSDLHLGPFALVLDRLSGSGGSLVLCPSDKPDRLLLLQRQLDRALVRSGLRRPGWRFNPHLTLLYRDGAPFARPVAPIGWQVGELALVHSHVGLTHHDILARWPLCPVGSDRLAA